MRRSTGSITLDTDLRQPQARRLSEAEDRLSLPGEFWTLRRQRIALFLATVAATDLIAFLVGRLTAGP